MKTLDAMLRRLTGAMERDVGVSPDARPSLLLDLLAGRPTEVEWINGSVPREGAKVGVAAPANELVTVLVLAKQARYGPG